MGRDDEVKARTVYILHLKDRKLDEEHRLAYIGSTGGSLSARLYEHLSRARGGRDTSLVYRTLREREVDVWTITPLETRVCTSGEIVELEDEYIGLVEPSLNSYRAAADRETKLRKWRERSAVRCYCFECERHFSAGGKTQHLNSSWHRLNCLD